MSLFASFRDSVITIVPCHFLQAADTNNSSCQLLDGFAILIQVTLGLTALAALALKRCRERPRRQVRVWVLDVSKQFIGAGMIHFLNLAISYLAGRPTDGPATNLCVWYFLSLLVDTTVGIAILWFWLRVLEWIFRHCGIRDISSGHYGPPPFSRMLKRWARQTGVFILAEVLMKICIFETFQAFPKLFVLGDWILSHLGRANYRYQVVFVMFVFPFFMNAFQFCIIDTIIEGRKSTVRNNRSAKESLQSVVIVINNKQSDEQTPLL